MRRCRRRRTAFLARTHFTTMFAYMPFAKWPGRLQSRTYFPGGIVTVSWPPPPGSTSATSPRLPCFGGRAVGLPQGGRAAGGGDDDHLVEDRSVVGHDEGRLARRHPDRHRAQRELLRLAHEDRHLCGSGRRGRGGGGGPGGGSRGARVRGGRGRRSGSAAARVVSAARNGERQRCECRGRAREDQQVASHVGTPRLGSHGSALRVRLARLPPSLDSGPQGCIRAIPESVAAFPLGEGGRAGRGPGRRESAPAVLQEQREVWRQVLEAGPVARPGAGRVAGSAPHLRAFSPRL